MRRLYYALTLLGLLAAAFALSGCDELWPLRAEITILGGATGYAPLAVQFADTSVGPILSRAWDFGDPASGANNSSTLESPMHTYWENGIYTVALVVYGPEGRSSRATVSLNVSNPPPVAALEATPDHGRAPLTVSFDLSSSHDPAGIVPTPSGSIVLYSLDFGDGSAPTTGTDLEAPVSHTYATPGRRSATLTVVDNDGAAASAVHPVTVEGSVSSIESPGPDPVGLTYDGSSLWVSDSTAKRIYKVRPADGVVLIAFDAPGGTAELLDATEKGIVPDPQPVGTPAGLAWQDGALWVACTSDGRLYKVDPNVPTTDPSHVLSVIESTDFAPFGLAYGGGALWVSDLGRGRIFKVNPWTAAVLASIPAPGIVPLEVEAKGIVPVAPTGLAWANGSLWVTAGVELLRIDPATGAVLASTTAPGSTPAGLAFDGLHLWVCDPNGAEPGRMDRLVVP
jgi:sugar lactone lactonase YvrE